MRSRARPNKPPAKELTRRKAAALSSGGGKLPPQIRKKLDREPMPVREHDPNGDGPPARTRAGKRVPRGGRHDRAAEQREGAKPD